MFYIHFTFKTLIRIKKLACEDVKNNAHVKCDLGIYRIQVFSAVFDLLINSSYRPKLFFVGLKGVGMLSYNQSAQISNWLELKMMFFIGYFEITFFDNNRFGKS